MNRNAKDLLGKIKLPKLELSGKSLKQIRMRTLSIMLASGFVFTGSAGFFGYSFTPGNATTKTSEATIIKNSEILAPATGSLAQFMQYDPESANSLFKEDSDEFVKVSAQANTLTDADIKNMLSLVVENYNTIKEAELFNSPQTKKAAETTTAENKTTKEHKETTTAEQKTTAPATTENKAVAVGAISKNDSTTAPQETTTVKTTYPTSNDKAVISEKVPPKEILFDENGEPLNYVKTYEGKATAYSMGTKTATGTNVMPGSVAVNPKIIPYGTKMWIVSTDGKYVYGYAVAEDTGGFIKWKNPPLADLYFRADSACREFGVRNIKIYILPD